MSDSPSRFVQICARKYDLYALDGQGNVWKYVERTRRICEGETYEAHLNHTCEYQSVHWWEPLSSARGDFPGWPVTDKELAEQEVEELLK